MNTTLTRLFAASLVALPVAAMAADYTAADANADGMLSLEEVQAVMPEMTADTFAAADADGDGMLNQDELAAAQSEGLLPASDG
ncbi:EF-hand domain-containing protein [Marivita sp. GX14005]|uniref:EF-hand domain-containing protein n=1 Tax=Marivita sp. GX14005 TaxID=2942276 RepID=UPI002019F112|nr:EF-hand domain-containing protein [Marivita sp. GX14005]MCL3883582.1 EF-hand domain-containing protein [Marivita sp. GX14005]